MLDRYVSGTVDRMSPEAPVPVVRVRREWSSLGGAANVAANVASLGGRPVLIGLVGNDRGGEEVKRICEEQGMETVFFTADAPTVTKTRIISGQQIVRIDHEERHDWKVEQLNALQDYLNTIVADVALVLVSDYAKGTLSDHVLEMLMSWATKNEIRVIIDPKRSDWTAYHHPYLITPNLKELGLVAGHSVPNDDNAVVRAARAISETFNLQNILVTRSEEGMTLVGNSDLLNVPAQLQEVFDVSGAGDTVLATLGVSLSEGETLSAAVLAANAAAAIAVGRQGTVTVPRKELDTVLAQVDDKIIQRKDLSALKDSIKGRKVVFTNGCFDILHKGHCKLLEEARSFGDLLVVALNSDRSVKRLKGAERPENSESVRASTLASMVSVDYVMIFEEDTPYELLEELRADVLVKGGDYHPDEVVGKELVKEVRIVATLANHATTKMLQF
jgi:D-beta-D-heptose 7-phosphate kinase / D-beta-D-heptose 1-phosphate adenosyltransferase